jgi:hypothetical protein
MTKDSSVSSKAMVDTEDGKNCGVSTLTTKPNSEPMMTGMRAVGDADHLDALLAGDADRLDHLAAIGFAGHRDQDVALVGPGQIVGGNAGRLGMA